MRYELLLQAPAADVPFDAEAVDRALDARGARALRDGTRVLPLKSGDVEIAPFREGPRQVATELRIPLSDRTELLREALAAGEEIAQQAQARLYDPQLNRPVSSKDEGAVGDQFLRTAKYAGEMVGVSEALGASIAPVDDRLLKPPARVALGLIAFFTVLYLLLDRLTGR